MTCRNLERGASAYLKGERTSPAKTAGGIIIVSAGATAALTRTGKCKGELDTSDLLLPLSSTAGGDLGPFRVNSGSWGSRDGRAVSFPLAGLDLLEDEQSRWITDY